MKELTEIQQDIKSKKLKPIYAFDGEEAYYIDLLCNEIENNLLEPHERDFNLSIFYGKDSTWSTILNECRSYPVFAERRLVLVKEAQQLKDFSELDSYFQQPAATTVLVIGYKYKKIDGRLNALKSIKKNGTYFTFDKLKEHKLGEWIMNYCQGLQRKISFPNAELIAAHLGNDLQKIANEINKTVINIKEGEFITEEVIERYIGISKDYNIFQYPTALLERNVEKAHKIALYFMANSKEFQLVVITATVYSQFAKLYQYHYAAHLPQGEIASLLKIPPFFVKDYQQSATRYTLQQTCDAIMVLHEYNLHAVGMHVARNDIDLLKEMTTKILYI